MSSPQSGTVYLPESEVFHFQVGRPSIVTRTLPSRCLRDSTNRLELGQPSSNVAKAADRVLMRSPTPQRRGP